MAGVMNLDTRVYNLKAYKDGRRHVVRLAPGFNVVDDAVWAPFTKDAYTLGLRRDKKIEFGSTVDDLEISEKPASDLKSKAEPAPQLESKKKSKNQSAD